MDFLTQLVMMHKSNYTKADNVKHKYAISTLKMLEEWIKANM